MPSVDFRFHDLLRVRLNHAGGSFMGPLLSRYAAYRTGSSGEPDVTVNLGPFSPGTAGAFRVDDRIWIREGYLSCEQRYKIARWKVEIRGLEGERITANIDANAPARVVIAGETVPALIRLALGRKGAVLAHGSAVEKDGRALVFSGRSGAGKTITAARFMASGWRHLGDDSCILHAGRVYGLIQPMTVRFTYDVESVFGAAFSPRERAVILAKKGLALATAGRINLLTSLPPGRVLGGTLGTSGDCAKVVLMQGGETFRVEPGIGAAAAAERILANIRFESRELDAYLQAYSHVFPRSALARFWEEQAAVLERTLEGCGAVALNVPRIYTDEVFAGIRAAVGAP